MTGDAPRRGFFAHLFLCCKISSICAHCAGAGGACACQARLRQTLPAGLGPMPQAFGDLFLVFGFGSALVLVVVLVFGFGFWFWFWFLASAFIIFYAIQCSIHLSTFKA
jgi:hypothetical protein